MDLETNYMVISRKEPMLLVTFTEVIAEIEYSLAQLKQLAKDTDFNDEVARKRYYDNLAQLKRFYERGERIALDEKARRL